MKARLVGLVAIAIGLVIGWHFGLGPIAQARAGVESVRLSTKAFLAAPMFVVAGIALIVGGAPVWDAFNGPPRGRDQHLITWGVLIVTLAAGALGYWWIDAQMDALGYR
jgi:hypothetical protein